MTIDWVLDRGPRRTTIMKYGGDLTTGAVAERTGPVVEARLLRAGRGTVRGRAPRLRRVTAALATAAAVAGCAQVPRSESPSSPRAGPRATSRSLSGELRARIDAFVAAGGTEAPTTPENADARAELLYEWGNAWALAGNALPVDLTLAVHSFRQLEAQGAPPTEAILRQIDRYLAELALLDREPEALGATRFELDRPLVAGTWTTVEQVYTAGSEPPRAGAVFVVGSHFMSDHGVLQFEDPAGDNYVSVRSSRDGARFEPLRLQWTSMHAGAGRSSKLIAYRLAGAELSTGDTVTFVYGDTSGGSRGFAVQTMSTERLVLPIYVDLDGGGNFFSPQWASLRVVGEREPAAVDVFAPTVVDDGAPFEVAIRAADRFWNRPTGAMPAWVVTVAGETIARVPAGAPAVVELPDVVLRDRGVHRLEVRDASGRLGGLSNPVLVADAERPRVVWGELHGHTDFAEAQGTPDEYFRYATEDARLDFFALTEHDAWLDWSEWRRLQELATDARGQGTLAFLAYEWTAQRPTGGHHNVFFRATDRRMVPMVEAPTLPELYRGLRAEAEPADVLVIPHAHTAGDWTTSDPELERLVEMYSMHGTFEWFGNLYLRQGWEVGFIGGSDDHRSKPGLARSSHLETLGQRGGLAAVMVPERSADAVFDGLRSLQAYATSGERILLDATLNGFAMGTRQPQARERRLLARIGGTAPLDRIDVVKNGEVVHSVNYLAAPLRSRSWVKVGFESSSEVFPPPGDNPRLYRVWEGTLDVHGARLRTLDDRAVDNRYTESVARDAADPARVRYHIETRGRRDAILLELDGASADTTLAFDVGPGREVGVAAGLARPPAHDLPPLRFSVRLGDLRDGRFEREVALGRHVDRITVELVDVDAALDRELEWSDLGAAAPGDYYYLRVTQLDGARAWSSPWWVGGRGRAPADPPEREAELPGGVGTRD